MDRQLSREFHCGNCCHHIDLPKSISSVSLQLVSRTKFELIWLIGETYPRLSPRPWLLQLLPGDSVVVGCCFQPLFARSGVRQLIYGRILFICNRDIGTM